MAKQDLTVFTRDQQTGVMKELAGGELKDLTRASQPAGPPQFNVLVAGDDESERRLTIWQLGKAWPADRDMMVECAADGTEALEKIRSNQYDLVVLDWVGSGSDANLNASPFSGRVTAHGTREPSHLWCRPWEREKALHDEKGQNKRKANKRK